MRALLARIDTAGPHLDSVDVPPLGSGDLRVAVAAAGVNLFDAVIASGTVHAQFGLPDVVGVGYDLAGTVIEIGAAVSEFTIGDRVAAIHDDLTAPARAHAETAVVPTSAAARVPVGLDLVHAATVPLNALTAVQAVDRLGTSGEPKDRTVLVTGAAGAVGGHAAALASRAGFQVHGLARVTDEEFVGSVGAVQLLTELPDTPRFDAVIDAGGLGAEALRTVIENGIYVGVNPVAPVSGERGIEAIDFFHQPDGARLAELLDLTDRGVLPARIAGTMPLSEAPAAYGKVAAGGTRGRWVLTP